MIGRRSSIGIALLCAFAFCAFAAQSATALVAVEATNTTAVTCVLEGGKEDFEDAHCDKKVTAGTGSYGHVVIEPDTTTDIDVVNVGTQKLNGVLAGVNTEVSCEKAASEKSSIHNVEVSGKHTVTGTVLINFSDCKVIKPLNCTIKEPIVTTANFEGVEGFGPSKNTMGIQFKGEGASGEFASLSFEGPSCTLKNGNPFLVKGSAIATGTTATQSETHSGATSVFEDKNEMETLEIGLKKASFAGEFTTSMSKGGNPIALTTAT
jgi:hypothetical protein